MKKFGDIRSFFKTNTSSALNDVQETVSIKNLASSSCEKTGDAAFDKIDSKIFPERSNTADELGTLQSGPSQPSIDFPKTKFGTKMRSFSSRYYGIYKSWLEYSKKEDKIFCFVCRHFDRENVRDQNEKFAKSGFNNWKKISEALRKHEESSSHSECSQKYICYKQSVLLGNVQQQLVQRQEEEIVLNREYLSKLIDIILTLVHQGLPLRGHREDTSSTNRGNFLEISQLFSKYDAKFSIHFEKHFNYCSPDIQNEIIAAISQLTLEEIVREVKDCGFFSLSVDEARCFKEEQLSIILRYAKNLEIVERFIGFVNCSTSRDAKGLATLIFDMLNKYNLNDLPIIGQAYDGASVMSGKNRGLQAIIKETHPQAVYIHCLAHKLNLVAVDSCANVSYSKSFFNGLESLYIHFSQPGYHESLKKIQISLGIRSNREMGSLSTTRWNCRYENCRAVLTNYEAIKTCLELEISDNYDKHSVEAIGLLTVLKKTEFIVSLHTFNLVLAAMNVLSKYFQSKNATLGQASDLIDGVLNTFEKYRKNFEIWNDIKQFAEKHDIELEPVRNTRKRRQRDDFHIETLVGRSNFLDLPTDVTSEEYWRINIYYQVIDNIVSNIKRRFENLPLARAVDAFLRLDLEMGKDFISNYTHALEIETSALNAEAMIMRNMLESQNEEIHAENLMKHLRKEFCPNLFKLLQTALVLPVSSVSCERSFSAMRRIKTWLRSTMGQERFSNLALLNIESEMVKNKVSAEKVLNRFAEKHRKLKLTS